MSTSSFVATLLLIDDDPSMVRLLTTMIQQGFGDQLEVLAYTDPSEAEARLEVGGIDILLTDLEMPEVDGLELLRCAKRCNAYTQVIFLTGHSSQDALLDALELGATDYLLKPVEKDELIELFTQVQSRQQRWRKALAKTWRAQHQATSAAST